MIQKIKNIFLKSYDSQCFVIKRKSEYLLFINLLMFLSFITAFTTHIFLGENKYIFTLGDILFLFFCSLSLYKLKKGNLSIAVNYHFTAFIITLFVHNIVKDLISIEILTYYSVLETSIIICIQFLIISLVAIEKYQLLLVVILNFFIILFHSIIILFKYYDVTNYRLAISHFICYFTIVIICGIISYMIFRTNKNAIKILDNEFKNTKIDLMKNESLLRTIIDTAPIFIAYINKNHIFKIANSKHIEIYKNSIEEIEGQHFSTIFPQKLYNKQKFLLNQSMNGKTVTFNDRISTKHGKWLHAYGIYTPFYKKNGENDGVVAIILDITEQKTKEKQIRLLNQKLIKLSTTDHLTKVYNRRKILEIAYKEFKICKKNNHNFSICMIDIDHFKKVNDTYGHAVGDIVIKQISRKCKNFIRTTDSFGRIGGEEFIVVLPETNIHNALYIAERIRLNISNTKIKNNEDMISVTISIGVCSLSNEENLDSIIHKADKALYDAKNSGRNKVCAYNNR